MCQHVLLRQANLVSCVIMCAPSATVLTVMGVGGWVQVDQEFKRFMACGADEIWEGGCDEGICGEQRQWHVCKGLQIHGLFDTV